MLQHHLQQEIVFRLARQDGLRFSELKPDGIDNNLFTYHLRQTIIDGIVQKNEDNTYQLTAAGRRIGTHADAKPLAQLEQADSVLFLAVRRRSDNAWLLYRRLTHPLLHRVGFMHARPNAHETTPTTAAKTLHQLTGLQADFKVCGSGYSRVFEGDRLESFTHFTLLMAEVTASSSNNLAQPQQNNPHAEYFWQEKLDTHDPAMLPNMADLVAALQNSPAKTPFYFEQTYQL